MIPTYGYCQSNPWRSSITAGIVHALINWQTFTKRALFRRRALCRVNSCCRPLLLKVVIHNLAGKHGAPVLSTSSIAGKVHTLSNWQTFPKRASFRCTSFRVNNMCFRYLLEVVDHQFVERDVFTDLVIRKTLLVVECCCCCFI